LARERKKFLFTIKNFVTADSITTIRKRKKRRNPDLHYRGRFCIRIHHKIQRCRNTGGIFSERKPLNCYGLTKKVVYENEEFNLLQAALNIEESLEDLRYNQVIIATDADVDGMHIRLLMITFFLQFFPDLIKNGHLYILQTPLFRVRNKKKHDIAIQNRKG
jgi:DNA gyrase/topoisomerase IV subunit B